MMAERKKTCHYALVDGKVYAVDSHIKHVMICHRGLLYGKDRKPEVVTFGYRDEWTPKKEILQARNENGWLMPIRISNEVDESDAWKKMVYSTTQEIPAFDCEIIDCRTES